MFTKTSFLLAIFFICNYTAKAQMLAIEENKPAVENGIEYGYIIKNEQVKTSKGEEYSRFEITLYISNKSGCTKLYANHSSYLSSENASLLATFNCINANGKRFTSKSSTLKARDFYVSAKHTADGKEITEQVKAGYIFRSGETINSNIIVLVPKGDRPLLQAIINNLPELQ